MVDVASSSNEGARPEAAVKRFSGDGTDPETDYRRWKRWSRAYLSVQKARGIAEETHGSLLYTLLDGAALATFDSVAMDDIDGLEDMTYTHPNARRAIPRAGES